MVKASRGGRGGRRRLANQRSGRANRANAANGETNGMNRTRGGPNARVRGGRRGQTTRNNRPVQVMNGYFGDRMGM